MIVIVEGNASFGICALSETHELLDIGFAHGPGWIGWGNRHCGVPVGILIVGENLISVGIAISRTPVGRSIGMKGNTSILICALSQSHESLNMVFGLGPGWTIVVGVAVHVVVIVLLALV